MGKRTQFDFFMTRQQLAEVLVELCPRFGASIVASVQGPDIRGLQVVPPNELADFLRHHKVPVLRLVLGPLPGQDHNYGAGNTQQVVVISVGAVDERKREIHGSDANAIPGSPAWGLLEAFKAAVGERSNKGMIARDDPNKRVRSYYWERSLQDWNFPDYELVGPKPKQAARPGARTKKSL